MNIIERVYRKEDRITTKLEILDESFVLSLSLRPVPNKVANDQCL